MTQYISVYSKNYEESLKEQKYGKTELKDYFEDIGEDDKGKVLRTTTNYTNGTLLKFDRPIRENPFLSRYLYSGTDYAKNYLIDQGFFVSDDSLYNSLRKEFINAFSLEYTLSDGHVLRKEKLYAAVEQIQNYDGIREKCPRVSGIWQYYVDQNKSRKLLKNGTYQYEYKPLSAEDLSEAYDPDHVYYEYHGSSRQISKGMLPKASDYIDFQQDQINKLEEKLKNKSHYLLLIVPIFIFLILFLIYLSDSGFRNGINRILSGMMIVFSVSDSFISYFLLFLPFILLIFAPFLLSHSMFLKKEKRIRGEIATWRHYASDLADKQGKKIMEIFDRALDETDQLVIEKQNLIDEKMNTSDAGLNEVERIANFDLVDENNLFNLIMYFGYPYTFATGELFRPVYPKESNHYLFGIKQNFEMIREYLAYMNDFVYPMIRQYMRKEDGKDVFDLNGFIINELRTQTRQDGILGRLDSLRFGLAALRRSNEEIIRSINNNTSNIQRVEQEVTGLRFNYHIVHY